MGEIRAEAEKSDIKTAEFVCCFIFHCFVMPIKEAPCIGGEDDISVFSET